MARKIIIDTDPGVDDLLAIVLALGAPELEVIGLTTVFGNVSIELTTANALAILEVAGRSDIPVARGAGEPWHGGFTGGVPHIHGESGLGDHPPVTPATHASPLDAAEFIHQAATSSPGEVTVFAIGPLTNLADAARRYPGLPQLIDEVVIMGGNAYAPGNITPDAEANIFHDPEAASAVFGLPWKITMLGLDVTDRVTLSPRQIEVIGEGTSELHSMLRQAMAGYQRFHEGAEEGYQGLCPHDATALCWLLQPVLFQSVVRRIEVEIEGPERGKTRAFEDAGADGTQPAVTVPVRVRHVETAAFIRHWLSNLPGSPSHPEESRERTSDAAP